MPITATLTVTPSNPGHGQTVTATYAVQGNTGTPAKVETVAGNVQLDGLPSIDVSTTLTIPAVAPLGEYFSAPTMAGLTFQATADPKVWTALVP